MKLCPKFLRKYFTTAVRIKFLQLVNSTVSIGALATYRCPAILYPVVLHVKVLVFSLGIGVGLYKASFESKSKYSMYVCVSNETSERACQQCLQAPPWIEWSLPDVRKGRENRKNEIPRFLSNRYHIPQAGIVMSLRFLSWPWYDCLVYSGGFRVTKQRQSVCNTFINMNRYSCGQI